MSGETDLAKMLRTLEPVLDPRRFVFSTHKGMSIAEAARLDPVGVFHEAEGLTVIAEAGDADDAPRYALLSLSVHSSLEAVGLTAAFSAALGEAGISANVVAAFYHDHIFVAERDAERAIEVLRNLARNA